MDNKKNIFEKIGAFVPGYKGYAEKEGRRDCDKLLRMEIAKTLDQIKEIINEVILQQMNEKNLLAVNDLDKIKKKLDISANQIRFANYGESGFFDIVQVDIPILDKLYQYDLAIKEEIQKIKQKIKSLQDSEDLKKECTQLIKLLSSLSAKMENRDEVITEVR